VLLPLLPLEILQQQQQQPPEPGCKTWVKNLDRAVTRWQIKFHALLAEHGPDFSR
jgi:hypothetical protein